MSRETRNDIESKSFTMNLMQCSKMCSPSPFLCVLFLSALLIKVSAALAIAHVSVYNIEFDAVK